MEAQVSDFGLTRFRTDLKMATGCKAHGNPTLLLLMPVYSCFVQQ
jgi:hypothetical protein